MVVVGGEEASLGRWYLTWALNVEQSDGWGVSIPGSGAGQQVPRPTGGEKVHKGISCLNLQQEDETPLCIRDQCTPRTVDRGRQPWPFQGTPGWVWTDSGLFLAWNCFLQPHQLAL